MGKMSGLFLMLAGTAGFCAAYAMHLRTPTDHGDSSPQQGDVMKGPTSGSDLGLVMAPEGWRTFLRAATRLEPAEAEPAPVVVTIARRTNEAAVKTPIAPPGNSATSTPGDRPSLARELQRELRRVGCYDGELNGSWTVATRKAMKAFTNRVNATLPTDGPDYILLALLRGHPDRACGIACPAGQGLADADGRCLPNAILAGATQKVRQRSTSLPAADQPAVPVITGWSTTTAAPPALRYPGEGRMTLAGPPEEQAKTPVVAPVAAARAAPTRVVVAPHREVPRRSNFGPAFFRQVDVLGLN
jgi:hypothetical protein